MNPTDLVLSRLEGVKRVGERSFMAKCPSHADGTASLGVKEGDDGRCLLRCHAGCTAESIVENVELAMSDLFPEKDARGSSIVAKYDYRDETGKLLYQVVRMVPKTFRQRQPDGNGWKWTMEGARRVPYRLPELLKSDKAKWCAVVEGEKDADALATWGIAATTNVGGAGKWRDEYGQFFRGRVVVVFPDNDQAGSAHAAHVAKCLAGVAAAVKIVQLPDLPNKGDVSDWISAGGTRAKLDAIVEQAAGKLPQTFKPSVVRLAGERAIRVAAAGTMLTFGVAYLDHALGGIRRSDVVLYGAKSGKGKSALATITSLANCRRGRRVHYFALEADDDREIERRMKYQVLAEMYYRRIGGKPIRYQDWEAGLLDGVLGQFEDEADAQLEDSLSNLRTFYQDDSFTSDDFIAHFASIQDETDLVVLDHFHYVDSDDDNENRAAKKLVKQIKGCAKKAKKPVIVVAHLRKADRQRETLVPDLEDFHGCKDLGNIASKAVVIAPAYGVASPDSYHWGTYVAAAKNRTDMSVSRYVALNMFNVRTNTYEEKYSLGRLVDGGKKFKLLPEDEVPFWAKPDGTDQDEIKW